MSDIWHETWKTVSGGDEDLNDLVRMIRLAGMKVQPAGSKAIEKFASFKDGRDLNLSRHRLENIGGCANIPGDKVLEVAKNFGLCSCPVDFILRLRLEYRYQPLGECLRIITTDSDGKLWIFILYNQDREGMCLSAYDVRSSDHEQPYYEFVFAS